MADDIIREEFEKGGTGNEVNRLGPGEAGTAGGANANADLREKGDADDIAEAIIQVDSDTADREVGLRSDSPVDLTRMEQAENGRSHVVEAEAAPVIESAEQRNENSQDDSLQAEFAPERDDLSRQATSRAETAAKAAADQQDAPQANAAPTHNPGGDPSNAAAPAGPQTAIDVSAPAVDEEAAEIEDEASDKQAVPNDTISVKTTGRHNDEITGSDSADYIDGGRGADQIFGAAGDDTILGGRGSDTISGGDGNDIIDGGQGFDYLSGGDGDDILTGGNGRDQIDGGAGNDTLKGNNGRDILDGGTGDDILTGGNGADTFVFGENFGNDVITDFKPNNDQIDLSALGIPDLQTVLDNAVFDGGNTVITTDHGTITLENIDPSDLSAGSFLFGDAPVDTTTDADTADTATDAPVDDTPVVDTTDTATDTGAGDGVDTTADQDLDGSDGDDHLVGGTGDDTIDGGNGSDTLDGSGGGDEIQGGNGEDNLQGGAGDDLLNGGNGKDVLDGGAGNDTLTGGNGNDMFSFQENFGNDTITDFKPGNDQLDLSSLEIPDLQTVLDNAVSHDGNTVITTDHGTITLEDIDPSDLSAGDFVFGDAPVDPAIDTDAADTGATDTGATDTPTDETPVVDPTATDDGSTADSAGDNTDTTTDTGTGAWTGDDSSTGGDGGGIVPDVDPVVDPVVDTVAGETIDGGNGKDTLEGGAGNDTLDGGNGKDVLEGGAGDDTLTGGNGNDTFAFEENFGNDTITDFKPGNDQLDLSSLGIPDLQTVLDNAVSDGTDTVITTDQGTITLEGVDPSDLSAGDFIFGDAPVDTSTDTDTTGADTTDAPAGDTASDEAPVVDTQPAGDDTQDGTAAGDQTTTGGDSTGTDAGTGGDNPDQTDTSGDQAATGGDGDGAGTGTGADTGTDPVADTPTGGDGGGIVPDVDPVADPVVDTVAGETIDGGNGKDTLEGGAGNDTLDGGNGKDILEGGAGDDTLTGGNGNDTFAFEENFGNDTITDFKPGNDQLDLSSLGIPDLQTVLNNAVSDGTDTVITTDQGTITLEGVDPSDLSAGDFVFGDASADTATDETPVVDTQPADDGDSNTQDTPGGGAGTDGENLGQTDTSGHQTTTGGDGGSTGAGTGGSGQGQSDTSGDQGATGSTDTGSNTGAGTDTVTPTGGEGGEQTTSGDTTGQDASGTGSDAGTGTETGSNEQPTGEVPADPVVVPPAPTIEGGTGSDRLGGTDGADIVDAGAGNDKVDGGSGDDIIDGGSGNDRLEGGDGADTLTGGEGTDTLYGGDGGDTLGGGEGADYLNSGKGDDVISGGTGDDKAYGGDGNDIVDGGEGNDKVYGNDGDDTVTAGTGDDKAYGGDGNDSVSGGDGNDEVHGNDGNDILDGGAGDDVLHGGSGEDIMEGGDGTDRLSGGNDNDSLAGGGGDDRLYGGSGDDRIDGGAGDDYLKGDSGADTFVFEGEFGDDSIRDFNVGQGDSIDLSGTEIGDFRSLMDNSRQDGNDTVIDLDGGSITLRDVDRNELSMDDFAFADSESVLSEPGSVHEIPDLPAFDSLDPKSDGANGVHPDAVTVSSAQTVTMTFEGETAGYQSSVGYYTVDENGVIENVEMAWENASVEGGGGDLVGGETSVSFDADAGSRVGVFLVPNGNRQNDFEDMGDGHFEFRDDAGEPATINTPSPTLVFVQEDGNEITIDSQSGEIFHSAGQNMHSDDMEHSFSGTDDAGNLMIGFEDLLGGGDRSFDDLIVKLEFEPVMEESAPGAEDSAFADGSGDVVGADIEAVGFDFVAEGAGAEETVFNLDFSEIIPEGADEGQYEVRVNGLPGQVSASKGDVDSDRNWTLTMMQVVGLTIAVPTAASAAGLMEDVTFQVLDTETGQVVAEGLLDGEALEAGESTISLLPQIIEEEKGNNGKAKGHDKQEEKAAAEEAEAANEGPVPVEEDTAPETGVNHVAAPAIPEETVAEIETETDEIVEEVAEEASAAPRNDAVAEVNVAPTDLDIDNASIIEHATNGTVVGTVSTTDANSGDRFTYTLTDDAGGRFAINASTGEVTVADTSLLDFETTTSHDVTVKVTDAGGNTYDEVMTINITDGNDAPTGFNLLTFAVGEESWINNNAVGQVNPIDPDAGETFTYALTDDAGGRFSIDANGMIRIADASSLDYESATSHSVTIEVTDSAGNTYDRAHTIHLYDENEAATDMSITASTVAENAANGTVVGTVSTTDVDAGDTHTYALLNDQGGRFAIDANTGVVTVADGSKLDFETLSAHDITIRVTDSGGATYDETMTINLTDVNETPTDLKLTNVEIAEGAVNGTVVGTAAVTDADSGDTATYSLTNNAGGRFTINSSTGEITVADGSLLDYESSASHDITVQITDGGGNTYDETFTIGVNDEREESNTYEAEIVDHGPVGYWQMDEVFGSAGTHTMAATVGGVDAQIHNTDTGTENNAFSNISGAMTDFYGDDYMVIPDDSAWQLTDGTVQMIFKPESVSGQHILVSRASSGTNEGDFKVYLNGDDVVVELQGTNGGTLTAADALTQNSWYQIDVTFGSGGLEIWLNGTRVANDPAITGGIDGTTEPWVIGASSAATTTGDYLSDNAQWESDLGAYFNGDIGEFAIFDSQLDSTAINDMYDAGVDGHDNTTGGSTTDNDMISGTAGNDNLGGHNGDDFIYGGDGDDTIDGGAGNDVMAGGAGTDTADYSGFGAGATVNLETGTATDGGGSTDTLSGIENVTGTNFNDTITGNDADNVLTGNSGNDNLYGGDGDDTIYGGIGNDTITGDAGDDLIQGGSGDDNISGGAGIDTVTYDGAASGVTVNLATGTATDGNGDTDTLTGIENIIGSANGDTFTGNGSVNEFTGGDGSDRFIMGEGGTMDTVHGGTGGGWTDTLQLMNADSSSVAGGWTVQLTTGSVQNDDGSTMTLTDDAAGTITLDDGSQIAFDGLEKIEY